MAFCRNCGNETSENATFCQNCGQSVTGEVLVAENNSINGNINNFVGMKCPKCSSTNVSEAAVQKRSVGCISIILYGLLVCIPVIGWIVLVYLLVSNKSKTVYTYLCRDCKKNWTYNPNRKKEIAVNIISIVVLLIIVPLVLWYIFETMNPGVKWSFNPFG